MTDIEKAIEEVKAESMPFDCWEQLPGETSLAFSAFCVFRDLGAERNLRKAVEVALVNANKNPDLQGKKYNVWRNWCCQYRWRVRVTEYDRYMEKLKQGELRKTIEAQGEKHRAVTGKMLNLVEKKLDLMNPAELTQGNVTEWVQTAIKAEREAAGLVAGNGKPETKQGELNFTSDFEGL